MRGLLSKIIWIIIALLIAVALIMLAYKVISSGSLSFKKSTESANKKLTDSLEDLLNEQ